MKATQELAKHVGVKPACTALRVSRATFYGRRSPTTGHQQPRPGIEREGAGQDFRHPVL